MLPGEPHKPIRNETRGGATPPSRLSVFHAFRPRKPGRRRGSALLLVLWVIGLLAMIVVSFAFDAHLEGKIVSYSRKRLRAEALAQSGMEVAKMLLDKQKTTSADVDDETKEKDEWYEPALALSRGRSATVNLTLGEGTIRLDIEPEEVWRNINKLTEEDWERIFYAIGLPEEFWPELIDSYFDWTDPDDMPRDDGAETDDYYATLDPPYVAANGPFDTVRELLLVKGFNEAILSGGVFNPDAPKESRIVISNGVERLLTTYGDGKVNVNAVRQDNIAVLLTLPGVTDIVAANAILEEREQLSTGAVTTQHDLDEEDTSYKSVGDFMSRVGDLLDDDEIRNHITTKSSYFRITSVGQVGRTTRRIWAVVYADDKDWRILRWREEP